MRLSIRIVLAVAVASVISSLFMGNAVAQTAPNGDGIHCKTQDGFNPYCDQQEGLIADRHGFKADHSKYCYWAQNYWSPDDGSDQQLVVRTLGHHAKETYDTSHGRYQRFCGDMPKRGCPKLNFMGKVLGTDGNVTKLNLGTYPTCGAKLTLSSVDQPAVKVCDTNNRGVPWPLQLKTQQGTLKDHALVRPGAVACVTARLPHHGSYLIRAMWKAKTAAVYPRNVLFDSYVYRD
jgi:hypothetical protein